MTPRSVLAAVLALCIGLLPLAPREHVHEVEAPDGHHETVAHRHAESHRVSHDGGHDRRFAQHGEAAHGHTARTAHHADRARDTNHHETEHHETAPSGAAHDSAIDHAESVVTQIAATFTLPQDGVPLVPALEVSTLAAAPRAPTRAAHGPFVERLIHGPPATPTAPRPPPSSTRL